MAAGESLISNSERQFGGPRIQLREPSEWYEFYFPSGTDKVTSGIITRKISQSNVKQARVNDAPSRPKCLKKQSDYRQMDRLSDKKVTQSRFVATKNCCHSPLCRQ